MMKCAICKTWQTRSGAKAVTLQRANTVIAVRDVPAKICENCGEYYLSEPAAKRVYADAGDSAQRHAASCIAPATLARREIMNLIRTLPLY